jgi:hypothetical protein
VTVPTERDAPAWVLAGLRAIDPTAEVVYVGEGRWWVGVVATPNKYRQRFGMRLLRRTRRQMRPDPAIVRQGLLACEGFSMVAEYEGDPNGAWIDDFARRDHEWRYESDKDQFLVEERFRDGERKRIEQEAHALLDAQGRDIHRSIVRGRIVVPVTRGLP